MVEMKIKPLDYNNDIFVEKVNGSPMASHRSLSSKLFKAIKTNNLTAMTQILNGLTAETLNHILNTPFSHLQETRSKAESMNLVYKLNVRFPLSVALYYQSFECFQGLVDKGADIYIRDHGHNNLVHLLVYVYSHENSQNLLKFYDAILATASTSIERGSLLYHRNDGGLTPLELSVKLRCVKMFRGILYTEGVYRTRVHGQGTVVTSQYTFDNCIDKPQLMSRSFLWQMVWLEENAESVDMIKSMLTIKPLRKLLTKRFSAVSVYLTLWALMRVLMIVGYLILDLDFDGRYTNFACYANKSLKNIVWDETFSEKLSEDFQNQTLPFALWFNSLYGTSYSVVTFAILILEMIFLYRHSDLFRNDVLKKLWRPCMVNTNFYQIISILLALNFISGTSFTIQLATGKGNPNKIGQGMSIMKMNEGIFLTFAAMYFLQVFHQGGFFVIGFQKMLSTLGRFALLQFSIIFIFATMFRQINVYFCLPAPNSCEYFSSIYQTFLIMLNMKPVTRGRACSDVSTAGNALLQITHIVYTFVVAILTVNYLIAVMSSVYQIFTDAARAVVDIHRVHMFLTVERRLSIFRRFTPDRFKLPEKLTFELKELDEEIEGLKHLRLEYSEDHVDLNV